MLKKQLTQAPTADLLTVADIKPNARIEADDTDLDTLIEELLPAAVQFAEHHMERVIMPQTWECYMDAYQPGWVDLPVAPVQSVSSVKYTDVDGNLVTLPETDYELDNKGTIAKIRLLNSFQAKDVANAVTITVEAGYGSADAVPLTIKRAVIVLVTHWLENANGVAPVKLYEAPASFEALLSLHMVHHA